MGDLYGEYTLAIDDECLLDRQIVLHEFPELKIHYTAYNQSMLIIKVNTHTVTINKDDVLRSHVSILGEYVFQGRGGERKAITFSVAHQVNCCSDSGDKGTEIRSYREGNVFIIEFTESAGTGHTWNVRPTEGIVLLEHVYITHCGEIDGDYQSPGIVNTHRFMFKAIKRGEHFIDALYARFWEEDEVKRRVGSRSRQYVITVV